ncbi:MAG: DMT family transporter, partial [Actinomycetota bacterium]|nr:DMT family transporter [Actinomycetota bacterium]
MDTAVKSEANQARPSWIAWALLALGILAASVSAILIRYAEDANSLAISFWRCALGALALLPFARWRQRGATRATVKTSALAGFFLALHFATWITSVGLTSVASSVLLVSTTPVFTA